MCVCGWLFPLSSSSPFFFTLPLLFFVSPCLALLCSSFDLWLALYSKHELTTCVTVYINWANETNEGEFVPAAFLIERNSSSSSRRSSSSSNHQRNVCVNIQWKVFHRILGGAMQTKICTSCILYNQNRHAMSCNANSKQHSILLCVAVLHDRID